MVLVERRRHLKATSRWIDTIDRHQSTASGENFLTIEEHAPISVGVLGHVQFSRCPCGFTLAKYDGRLFWIRAKPGIRELLNADDLARALHTRCWHYRSKNKSSGKAPMPVASSDSHTIGSR
jgi:hypothetical protein